MGKVSGKVLSLLFLGISKEVFMVEESMEGKRIGELIRGLIMGRFVS